MKKKTFYITTPIYYPNNNLHLGHAYCTVIADVIARYHRLKERNVYFLTGTDEHGQKIQRQAEAAGIQVKKFIDNIVEKIQKLWQLMNISNNDFIRTTEERHKKSVQYIFKKIFDNNNIYKSKYKGLYCTPCEAFWSNRQIINNKCPDCGKEVEFAEEESYFFKLSNYQDRLLRHIDQNPHFISPITRRNEIISFIKQGLEDLCVSRTTFSWGIPVPIDMKHIIYVWFDALSNYITALGYPEDNNDLMKNFWPANIHLVGKEITRFHCIIWPCLLMALGLPLPKQIYGHGWILFNNDKMSKSKENVVDPYLLIEKYGCDSLRYFLCREIQLGQDGTFSEESLIHRINADLANDLGNLLYRTLNMIEKFNNNEIIFKTIEETTDKDLIKLIDNTCVNYEQLMDKIDINNALKTIWNLINKANKYIDETRPWKLKKNNEEYLNTVLYNLAESLRVISILIEPFMPQTASKIRKQLGLSSRHIVFKDIQNMTFLPGTKINKATQLFPRIEIIDKRS